MTFFYRAYNIPVISEIQLPSLIGIKEQELGEIEPIFIKLGLVPKKLRDSANERKPFTTFNEQELLFNLPDMANYYIKDGNEIIIEPLCDNHSEIHLNIYSNCLAAILYQRNILPFHVSGVRVGEKVLLLAAPSGTGKSTTAVKLQELGYPIFTDDTAILEFQDGICYAKASYPMARLWQNTIEVQNIFKESEKKQIYGEADKYAFDFHGQFITDKLPVLAIVFIESIGSEIHIEPIQPPNRVAPLIKNIYRSQWVTGMKKHRLQHEQVMAIANHLPAYKAQRPRYKSTENTFASAIIKQIIEKL
jgi:hypothetical protein